MRAWILALALPASGRLPPPANNSYLNLRPPELRCQTWLHSTALTLESLRGKIVILVFWASYVDTQLRSPVLSYLVQQDGELSRQDVVTVLVTNEAEIGVRGPLQKAGARMPVGLDPKNLTYKDYGIDALPWVYLLDIDGNVVWEGNPEFHHEHGASHRKPLEDLMGKWQWKEVLAARPEMEKARLAFDDARLAEAFSLFKKVSSIGSGHPMVLEAKEKAAGIPRLAEKLVQLARHWRKEGRLLEARELLVEIEKGIPGTPAAKTAAEARRDLLRDPRLPKEAAAKKTAMPETEAKAWALLIQAEKQAALERWPRVYSLCGEILKLEPKEETIKLVTGLRNRIPE